MKTVGRRLNDYYTDETYLKIKRLPARDSHYSFVEVPARIMMANNKRKIIKQKRQQKRKTNSITNQSQNIVRLFLFFSLKNDLVECVMSNDLYDSSVKVKLFLYFIKKWAVI